MSKESAKVALAGLAVLAVLITVPQGLANGDPLEDLANRARQSVNNFLREYELDGDPKNLSRHLEILSEKGPFLRRIGDMRLVEPLIEILGDTTRFSDVAHFHAANILGGLRDGKAIPALKECLGQGNRERTRFAAGIALALLGRARTGLPVVEEYVKQGKKVEVVGAGPATSYVVPFFEGSNWKPLELPDKDEDEALNRYIETVLTCPLELERIYAIKYLLKKDGTNKDLAYEAAVEILDQPNPEQPEFLQRNREALLGVLRDDGGERGKAIAAEYER